MKSQTREVQYFLFSQYFSDGLRITLGVLLPCLLFVQLGHFEVGLVLSLGALCVSITDFPGPVIHKRNAMLACCLLIFLVALITGFVRQNSYLLAAEIGLFCFFFSMFTVYGNRAAAVGTAALVIMILSIDQELEPSQVVGYSALVLAGGIWYMLLSLVLIRMRPYRQAQQALGECTHEVSKYLRLRAGFYQTGTDLETLYEKVVRQQVVVHEKQDAVREVLFKDPQLFKNPTGISRTLILTFVDLMDLYEQITTTHYDYGSMREKFGRTGILGEIATQILRIADQLDAIGFAIQANTRLPGLSDLQQPLEELKKRIDALGEHEKEGSTLALKKIFVNVRNLVQRLNDIRQYYTQPPGTLHQPVEFSRFVTHQDFDPKLFRHNLTFNSAIFKHSFRVALVCLIGYAVTKIAPYGNHSYWVLLTIIVILKPAFSLTKQRNNQRIIGTLAGGAIGILILHFIPDRTAQFVFLLIFMVGNFSFQRRNYVVSVILMTPFVLILFNLLGNYGTFNLVEERIIDTLIGSAIAFSASYFVFPSWESEQMEKFLKAMLVANANYLQKLAEMLAGKTVTSED
ncbi:MAG TPA: FUSC family membrane protein, partial [Adhaeribacter sp.]|nr:FUSC family membrane protein [Adhaeribacter sp.]